ncbi:hypothetical protein [Endothiovibrio diazotrophicus]
MATTVLEDVTPADFQRVVAERFGIDSGTHLRVIIRDKDETIVDVAKRMREVAAERGLTEELLNEILNEDS